MRLFEMDGKMTINHLEKETEKLTYEEQLELVERLIRRLRKSGRVKKKESDVNQLYGSGKGLWEEDAQEYVKKSREDRS